jgi:hypothetical protein
LLPVAARMFATFYVAAPTNGLHDLFGFFRSKSDAAIGYWDTGAAEDFPGLIFVDVHFLLVRLSSGT